MKFDYCFIDDLSDKEYYEIYKRLTKSRKERIDTYKRQEDKRCSLLASYLAEKISGKKLANRAEGQPYLENSSEYVSISHCYPLVVCAVDYNPVGIDAEKVREVKNALIDRVCTKNEKKYIEEKEDINSAFFHIWTAKEAYFKMKGTGITDFKSIDILTLKREIIEIEDYIVQIVYEK